MKARALIAVGVAAAMLSGGAAVAADNPDDTLSSVAQTGTAAGSGAPSLEAPGTTDDALAAALSGNAATALGLINQYRAGAGLGGLREDPALTAMAQAWATHSANLGEIPDDPDLGTAAKPLPGAPTSPHFRAYGLWGPTTIPVGDFIEEMASSDGDYLYDAEMTHVGIGWSVNGSESFFYLIAVGYQFTDIGPSDTFYAPVDWLGLTGITTGYPDGSFRPTGQVSREAMAAFLYRYFNDTTTLPACTGTTRMFTDVTAGHPFCGAIEWLATEGISTGYPDGTFRPGQPVSREAMGAFLYRAFTGNTIPTCTDGTRRFTDVPASHPFCGALEWLASSGITTGWPDHTFRPGLSVERQAMAAFLYRAAD